MLVLPFVAVADEVRLEAQVGLGHRPVDRSLDEGKVRAWPAPDLKNLKSEVFVADEVKLVEQHSNETELPAADVKQKVETQPYRTIDNLSPWGQENCRSRIPSRLLFQIMDKVENIFVNVRYRSIPQSQPLINA